MSPDACERNTARAPARARGLPGSQKKHGFIARVQSTSNNNNEPRLAGRKMDPVLFFVAWFQSCRGEIVISYSGKKYCVPHVLS